VVNKNSQHADVAKLCLERQRDCIVEKPLDVDLNKAKDLLTLQKASGQICSVVSQWRFSDQYRRLRQLVEEGGLGKISDVRCSIRWPRSQKDLNAGGGWKQDWSKSGGGVLIQWGIHFIDLLNWIFGEVRSTSTYHPSQVSPHPHIESQEEASQNRGVERKFLGELFFQVETRTLSDDNFPMWQWPVRIEPSHVSHFRMALKHFESCACYSTQLDD